MPTGSPQPQRTHAALHTFTESLAQEFDEAISAARSRQLVPLRSVLGECRYVTQFMMPTLGRNPRGQPTHFTVNAELATALRELVAADFQPPLEALEAMVGELEPYEGVPFNRKPLRLPHSASPVDDGDKADPDDETDALSRLAAAAGRFLALFRDAVADLAAKPVVTPVNPPDSFQGGAMTPPQLARMIGRKVGVVYAWIHSGELRAINVAKKQGGNPRYLIREADWQEFEKKRQFQPAQVPAPARRMRGGKPKNYFPAD